MIGVFGGSGFYSLLEKHETKDMATPFGPPSSPLHFGDVAGKKVHFMARHGDKRAGVQIGQKYYLTVKTLL